MPAYVPFGTPGQADTFNSGFPNMHHQANVAPQQPAAGYQSPYQNMPLQPPMAPSSARFQLSKMSDQALHDLLGAPDQIRDLTKQLNTYLQLKMDLQDQQLHSSANPGPGPGSTKDKPVAPAEDYRGGP